MKSQDQPCSIPAFHPGGWERQRGLSSAWEPRSQGMRVGDGALSSGCWGWISAPGLEARIHTLLPHIAQTSFPVIFSALCLGSGLQGLHCI